MRRKRLHGDGCYQFIRWDDEVDTETSALQRHLDSGYCDQRRPPPLRKERAPKREWQDMNLKFLE